MLVINIFVYSHERPVVRFPWLRNGLLKTSRIIADINVHLCRFQQYKIINHSSFGVTHVVLFHFSIGPNLSKTVTANNCIVCHTMTTIIDLLKSIHTRLCSLGCEVSMAECHQWPCCNTVKSEDWCWLMCYTLLSTHTPHIHQPLQRKYPVIPWLIDILFPRNVHTYTSIVHTDK